MEEDITYEKTQFRPRDRRFKKLGVYSSNLGGIAFLSHDSIPWIERGDINYYIATKIIYLYYGDAEDASSYVSSIQENQVLYFYTDSDEIIYNYVNREKDLRNISTEDLV